LYAFGFPSLVLTVLELFIELKHTSWVNIHHEFSIRCNFNFICQILVREMKNW